MSSDDRSKRTSRQLVETTRIFSENNDVTTKFCDNNKVLVLSIEKALT